MSELQPELLLQAYAVGVFPMAEGRNDPRLFFVDPDNRGILPLDRFHIPKSLRKTVRQRRFEVVWDHDFEGTIDGCAAATRRRPDTWINPEIRRLYLALYARGHAHSVESWKDGKLVGGLYGVRLGGAFFGESMFSRATDASKVALVHLVAKLKASGFTLLDTQFITDHLARFGAMEIPRDAYRQRLGAAIATPVQFDVASDDWPSVEALLQDATQTS